MELGTKARDRVTNFRGIVTGHVRYLYGNDQYLIEAVVQQGERAEAYWVDESRVEVVDADPLETQRKKLLSG
jgi:hypothetical protein